MKPVEHEFLECGELVTHNTVTVNIRATFGLYGLSLSELLFNVQGPVSRKPWKLFVPGKPFLVHLYLKSVKCTRMKLLV